MSHKSRVILAADLPERDALLDLVRGTYDLLAAIKLSNLVLYELGWNIVSHIKRVADVPVLLDLKLMEVPFMAELVLARASKTSADAAMVCGQIGLDGLAACRRSFSKPLFAVTQFSHCRDVVSDYDADAIVRAARGLHYEGVQVPATLPSRIASIRRDHPADLKIICCGVGRQGPAVGSAVSAGADYEIIGREIYSSNIHSSSRAALKAAVRATTAALKAREPST